MTNPPSTFVQAADEGCLPKDSVAYKGTASSTEGAFVSRNSRIVFEGCADESLRAQETPLSASTPDQNPSSAFPVHGHTCTDKYNGACPVAPSSQSAPDARISDHESGESFDLKLIIRDAYRAAMDILHYIIVPLLMFLRLAKGFLKRVMGFMITLFILFLVIGPIILALGYPLFVAEKAYTGIVDAICAAEYGRYAVVKVFPTICNVNVQKRPNVPEVSPLKMLSEEEPWLMFKTAGNLTYLHNTVYALRKKHLAPLRAVIKSHYFLVGDRVKDTKLMLALEEATASVNILEAPAMRYGRNHHLLAYKTSSMLEMTARSLEKSAATFEDRWPITQTLILASSHYMPLMNNFTPHHRIINDLLQFVNKTLPRLRSLDEEGGKLLEMFNQAEEQLGRMATAAEDMLKKIDDTVPTSSAETTTAWYNSWASPAAVDPKRTKFYKDADTWRGHVEDIHGSVLHAKEIITPTIDYVTKLRGQIDAVAEQLETMNADGTEMHEIPTNSLLSEVHTFIAFANHQADDLERLRQETNRIWRSEHASAFAPQKPRGS